MRVSRAASTREGRREAPDPEIAERLGVSTESVRSARRRRGIPGRAAEPVRTGWQDRLREAHGRGLSAAELAEELGWTIRTVWTRASLLGLPLAGRRPNL